MMRVSIAVTLLLGLLTALACGQSRKTDLHWERARDLMMQEEVRAGGKGPDYADEAWLQVIEELSQVHPRFEHYEEAMALMEEVKAARSAAYRAQAQRIVRPDDEPPRDQTPPGPPPPGREPDRGRTDPFRAGPARAGGGGHWEIVLSSASSSRSQGTFTLNGEILNISDRVLTNVLVLAEYFDASGRPVRTVQGMLEPGRVPPGGYATFAVGTADSASLHRYQLRFRELAGSQLAVRPAEQPPGN
jgi:hypothetical protein